MSRAHPHRKGNVKVKAHGTEFTLNTTFSSRAVLKQDIAI